MCARAHPSALPQVRSRRDAADARPHRGRSRAVRRAPHRRSARRVRVREQRGTGPRLDVHARASARRRAHPGQHRRRLTLSRILIVEDEPNNLELALRIVRHAGHEAAVATDGITALELAREHRPELILLDLQLPKLDGWTVVKLLRKEPWTKDVPIVAVSASATPGDEHKALEAGCTAFLSKPYYPATLRDMLAR